MTPDLLRQYLDVARKGGAQLVQLKTPDGAELVLQLGPDLAALTPRTPDQIEKALREEIDTGTLYGSAG